MSAEGEVYNLSALSQFPGSYFKARAGFAAGDDGSGSLYLQNDNGVVLKLRSKLSGAQLSMGVEGVSISMDQ